jgi:hypothetical protein
MTRRISFLTILIFAALLCGCAAARLTVRPDTRTAMPAPDSAYAYETYWDAVEAGNLDEARRLGQSADEQRFTSALEAALNGETARAEKIARDLGKSAADSTVRAQSDNLLQYVFVSTGRWRDLLTFCFPDSLPDSVKNIPPLIEIFGGPSEETFEFAATPDTLPLRLNSNGMPLAQVTIHGRTQWFILDTGAGMSVLASDFARECGIVPDSGKQDVTQSANMQRIAVGPVIVDSLRLGGLCIRNHRTMIMDEKTLRFRRFGLFTFMKIDGILGWNAIRNLDLTIDYKQKRAIVRKPETREAGARNLLDLGQAIIVTGDDLGNRLGFMLDTGGAESSLTERGIEKIHPRDMRAAREKITGAGGSQKYQAFIVPQMTLYTGGCVLNFRKLVTHPEVGGSFIRHDGVLGSDIAQNGSMRIDARNGLFELKVKD